MTLSAFDRRIGLVFLCLVLLLGGVIWISTLAGLDAPKLESASLGAAGPIRLTFNEPVERESVEARLELYPPLSGRFTWAERENGRQTLSFWPEQPFKPGTGITLSLESGVRSITGHMLAEKQVWQITIRSPEILYLSPVEKPELWRALPDGSSSVQITSNGLGLYDYSPSVDGNSIAYSAKNEQGGLDLWEIDRGGGMRRMLIPCQTDWCSNPAYSPDGRQLAYTRRQATSMVGGAPGNPKIWMLDLQTLATDLLYIDPNVAGTAPSWSPDGKFLSFFDERASGIRVLDGETKQDFILPATTGFNGSWAPDSRKILFTDTTETEAGPYGRVYLVDIETKAIQTALGEGGALEEYSAPEWAPFGDWVAVGSRLIKSGASKQIWVMQVDGSQRKAVTEEQQINNAAYQWSPVGDQLVFQRLELTSSDQQPFIVLWSRADGRLSSVAQNAFNPRWLP